MEIELDKVASADGTAIAVETVGAGPPIVLVVGAFCDRTTTRELAGLLADRFTVHAYDRRGRGDSADAPLYAVDREIEDLAAVLAHAGGTPGVYGHSSGAILALRAAWSGLAVSRVAAYEPPWAAGDHAAENAAVAEQLGALVAEQRFAAATEYFLTAALDLSAPVVQQMKASPFWSGMAAAAPTLRYECAVTGDQRIPTDHLATITQPILLLAGGDSDVWARDTAAAAAAAVPGAGHRLVPGQGHGVDHAVIAPILAEFFDSRGATRSRVHQ